MGTPITRPAPDTHPVITDMLRLILERHTSFTAVAAAASIDRGAFTRWLRGDHQPTLGALDAVADHLGQKVVLVPAWLDVPAMLARQAPPATPAPAIQAHPNSVATMRAAAWLRRQGWHLVPPEDRSKP